MKNWIIPVASAQKFAANEYVSACTATISCDLALPEGAYKYVIYFDRPVETRVGTLTECVYKPCGEVHDVSAHGELQTITITEYLQKKGGSKITLDEPINCYFWVEMDENNIMQDGHCTLNADGFQSNKS